MFPAREHEQNLDYLSMQHYQAGNELFVDEEYDEALEKYNKAIDIESNKPEFYLKRAACHIKLKNFRSEEYISFII